MERFAQLRRIGSALTYIRPEPIPALDGLRGWAALTVLVSHLSNETGLLDKALGAGAGQLGVMLFFTLSGFLLGRIYLPMNFEVRQVLIYFRQRFARVVPLYLAIVLASFFAMQISGRPVVYMVSQSNIVDHLFFLSGTSVLWTIPVEIQYYVAFPIFWLAFKSSPALFWASAAVITALVFAWAPEGPLVLWKHLPFFLTGAVLSALPTIRLPSWVFAVSVVAFFAFYPRIVELSWHLEPFDPWRQPLYLLMISMVLVSSICTPMGKFALSGRLQRFLGAISYSIYLLHYPIILGLKATFVGSNITLLMITSIIATIAAATATYYLFEMPARKWLGISTMIDRRNLALG